MQSHLHSTSEETASHTPTSAQQDAIPASLSDRNHALLELVISAGLFLAAFIPRLLLAQQLDMVTDEGVYIQGGQTYFPLLAHLDINNQGWLFNHEHPPLVKLLIGFSLWLNTTLHQPLTELLAARLPSIILGTLLVMAVYWLGRDPFGRVVALLAALSLAFSPWMTYFSALAYLDMTMATFVTCALLCLWHAIRQPRFYLACAVLIGLGAASKYPAVLVVPGMFLFTAYYFFLLRPRLPETQRPAIPWRWWIASIILSPLVFLAVDPAIWPAPISRLISSFGFEWNHASNGHLIFLAGHAILHVPRWMILYVLLVKISTFVTIPALFFALFAIIQLIRFHRNAPGIHNEEVARNAFLLIWLLANVGMYSLLTIVVGTHYYLPVAPPVFVAGVAGLAILLRYRRGQLFAHPSSPPVTTNVSSSLAARRVSGLNLRAGIVVTVIALAVLVPPLVGLITIPGAEGYSSELFHGEDSALQVAYPGYREALEWIATQDPAHARVGLVALPGTLNIGSNSTVSWYSFNLDLARRFQLTEVSPQTTSLPYDYLVWPMHLAQRGYAIPAAWHAHIVHTVMGGATTYCYIMVNPTEVKP